MSFDWQEEWEKAAAAEYQYYALASDEQLCEELKQQRWGAYYRIWDVIKDRGKAEMIGPLFEALKHLKGEDLFLDRHHCTSAIFQLLKLKNNPLKKRIVGPSTAFDAETFEYALQELKLKIEQRMPT